MTRHPACALGLAILLTACSDAPAAAGTTGPAQAEPPMLPATTSGNCVIEVDGRVWLDRPCEHDYTAPDLLILNSDPPEGEDFVYLMRDSATEVTGHWSGGGGAAHAHDRLGTLRLDGRCWVNDRARICLSHSAWADFNRGWE